MRVDVNIEESDMRVNVDMKGSSYITNSYLSLRKLGGYIYEVTFDKLPKYTPSNAFSAFGCTSYVKDKKLYRNLDWSYNETAEFKIIFKDVEGISFIDGLNDGNILGRNALISQLPYRICDGKNGAGLMVSTHVLFNDFNYYGSGEKDVPITMLPFTVLTTMTKVDELSEEVENLLANAEITTGMQDQELLIQVLVTDGTKTMLFTPTEDGYEYIDISSNPKLTNFKWVDRPAVFRTDSDIQLRPTGIERWNMIDVGASLEELRFTLAYESPTRLSEFIGLRNTTKYTPEEELMRIYEGAHSIYSRRTRNSETWQTMHSVIYSDKGMEELFVQENYNDNYGKPAIPEQKGMEFYEVTYVSGQFKHGEDVLDYAKLVDKFEDSRYFLYLSYQNLVYIPSIDTNDALAFSVAWTRKEDLPAGEEYVQPYISRVIINTQNQVNTQQIGSQSTALILHDFSEYADYVEEYGTEIADKFFKKFYPTAKAVKDLVDGHSGGVTTIGGADGDILLGEGLQIDGQTLKALGGSGDKKYAHFIRINNGTLSNTHFDCQCIVVNSVATPFDIYTLRSYAKTNKYLVDSGFSTAKALFASGTSFDGTTERKIIGITVNSNTNTLMAFYYTSPTSYSYQNLITGSTVYAKYFMDSVIEL